MMANRQALSRWLHRRIGYNPEAARYMGLLAADYIEDGRPMPIEMRAWLATALRTMANVEAKANGEPVEQTRVAVLGNALGLTKRQGAPRFIDRLFVRFGLPAIANRKTTETAFAEQIAKAFAVSPNTARKHIRRETAFMPGAEACEWMDDILSENGIELPNGVTGQDVRMLVVGRVNRRCSGDG